MIELNNKQLGAQGETWALEYFLASGYSLIEKNYRIKAGEIDLIVENQEWVVFVEVKTRRNLRYGRGLESVINVKQTIIRKVAEYFLAYNFPKTNLKRIRFDVVDILVDANYKMVKCEHHQNAF